MKTKDTSQKTLKKLIVTADDYGVVPYIDDAIIEAVKNQKVNSVAAFSNYEHSVENAKRLLNETNGDVDLGVHLTITSGKPIIGDEASSLINRYRYFKQFSEFDSDVDLTQLGNEIDAQIMRFKDADIPISHLSSHHNALMFFEDIYKVYLNACKKHKLASRSPRPKPKYRYATYLFATSLKNIKKSAWDIDTAEHKALIEFRKKSVKVFKENSQSKIKTTDYFENRHYGPPPVLNGEIEMKDRFTKAKKKHVALRKAFRNFRRSKSESMELVLHLAKKVANRDTVFNNIDYPGIDPKYFDGRHCEFLSIKEFDFDRFEFFKKARWNEL